MPSPRIVSLYKTCLFNRLVDVYISSQLRSLIFTPATPCTTAPHTCELCRFVVIFTTAVSYTIPTLSTVAKLFVHITPCCSQADISTRPKVSLLCWLVMLIYRVGSCWQWSAGVAVSIKKPGVVPGISGVLVGLFCNHKVEYDLVDLIDL